MFAVLLLPIWWVAFKVYMSTTIWEKTSKHKWIELKILICSLLPLLHNSPGGWFTADLESPGSQLPVLVTQSQLMIPAFRNLAFMQTWNVLQLQCAHIDSYFNTISSKMFFFQCHKGEMEGRRRKGGWDEQDAAFPFTRLMPSDLCFLPGNCWVHQRNTLATPALSKAVPSPDMA